MGLPAAGLGHCARPGELGACRTCPPRSFVSSQLVVPWCLPTSGLKLASSSRAVPQCLSTQRLLATKSTPALGGRLFNTCCRRLRGPNASLFNNGDMVPQRSNPLRFESLAYLLQLVIFTLRAMMLRWDLQPFWPVLTIPPDNFVRPEPRNTQADFAVP